MRLPLNRRILFLLCLMFALVLAATHTLRTSKARSGAVRIELPEPAITKTSKTLSLTKAALGPRLQTSRLVSPFDWRNHNSLGGAAFFAPLVGAVKSAALAAGGDVNGNGFVNPGDTLAYTVVLSNTGADAALNVVFTDTLNANLTLVPGSVKASPIATNDLYGSIGNVGLNVPAAGGLLANDVSPTGNSLSVTAAPSTSAQGGALAVSSNGAFTYNPPVGFTGTDTFSYTISDGTQTSSAVATINVSGVIWFVNNTPGACSANCDGRLSNPFVNLSNLNAVNDGAAGHPKDNEHIFVYSGSGNYDGPLTLRAGQRLIGQGATASLAVITGLTVPTFSNPLPATGGTRPTSLHSATHVTLNTSNLIRGINLQSTAGTTLVGTSFNNLAVSETAVSATNSGGSCNAAVSLNQSSGTAAINATFISIAANTCTNGILLQNTTGSFSVTGDGANNASGGTIQNTSGNGVLLNNVQNVSLTSLKIQTTVGSGVKGALVNGFSFVNGTIDASNNATLDGTNSVDESNIAFNNNTAGTEKNVFGTVTITGSTLTNALYHGVDIFNYDGMLSAVTISGNTITSGTAAGTSLGSGIRLIAFGSASTVANVTKATISNNVVSNFPGGAGIQAQGGNANVAGPTGSFGTPNDATNIITITGNTVKGFSATTRMGTQAIAAVVNGKGQGNFNVSNNGTAANPLTNVTGAGIALSSFGLANVTATVNSNVIVANNALASSGIGVGTSRTFAATDTPSLAITISNNSVSQTDGNGIIATARDATGNLNVKIANNTVAAPLSGVRPGIRVDAGNTLSANDTVCLNISGNTSAGSGGSNGIGLRKQGTVMTTNAFGLQGIPQATPTNTDVINYVDAQNPAGGGTLIISGSNFAQCTSAPAIAPPVDTESEPKQQAANSTPSGTSVGLLARLQQTLRPVLAAFHTSLSYVSLDRAFSQVAATIAPTAMAAEIETAAPATSLLKPAKTLLINSKGEYSIVSTAVIPATFAGETITINGTGGGFTLPAGASTTIMFSATISASFTGTSISNTANISGSNFSTVTASVTTTVYQPPTISKAFAPTTIALNGTTTLTLTINNPNIAAINGVSVADTFPAGLEVDAAPMATNTCGGTFAPAPGATSISLSGGSIAASSACSVSVKVKGTTSGTKNNTTGNVNSTEGGMGNAASASLTVNNPPTITAIPQSVAAGSNAATYNIATVNDTEDGVAGVTFSISSDGVTFGNSATLNGVTVTYVATNGAGTVSASIATSCSATTANFTIKATDTTNQSSTTTLTITVTANPGPTLSYSSPQTLAAGASTTVNPATGPSDNGSVTTIAVDSVSPGTGLTASVNNSTGVVSLNATLAGSYTVNIKATDNCGAMTVTSFTVNVTCPTITVSPASLPNGTVGSGYNQTITASPAGGNYSFAVTSGSLPPGLTLGSNGNLTGTPTTTGTFSFTVTATGFGSCTSSQNYSITIGCPTITINTTSLPNTSRNALYNQTISVSPAGSYSFTVSSGALPPGLSLNSSTGTISGTPTTNGSYTFTVTVSAGGSCTASRTYTISVNGVCGNVTQHDNLPNGTVNVAYFGSLAHVTPTNDYIITLQAGTLPPGLVIDNVQKALVGTPTTAGSYTFTLRATAPSGCYDDRIYTVVISSSVAVPSDFDGDRKADPALFRVTQAGWLLSLSGTQTLETPVWGAPGDQIAAGDYDGDGKVDLAVFSPATGEWRIKRSSDGATVERAWGAETDTPVPGDYDGDGKTDIAVWRSSEGNWRIVNSSDGAEQIVQWGLDASGADALVPVPSDYDGDGKTDLAVFNKLNATWSIRRSSDGAILTEQWGLSNDTPVPGDYDGDGKADLAVWRGAQGRWLILRSSDNTTQTEVWGASAAAFKDVPVPGDYDGDGKIDLAVWRPALGMWYSRNSSDGTTHTLRLGQNGDLPVTAARGR